jgi:hypothetical protein
LLIMTLHLFNLTLVSKSLIAKNPSEHIERSVRSE